MFETVKTQWAAKVAVGFFLLLTIWWVVLQFMNLPQESEYNQLWAAVYGIVAFWGGLWGIIISRKWGGLHSVLGRSILFFALGLLSQEVGQVAYSYYIYFLHQPVPYPSLGDYFFWATIPFYTIAVVFLAQASGVRISLQSMMGKLQVIVIPAIVLVICYSVFLQEYQFDLSQPVKTIIDFGVPIGEAIYISLAFLTFTLTRGTLGGIMRTKVLFVLIALLLEFTADWVFLYQVSREIWYAGGMNDYMYFVAYFVMAIALIRFDTVYNKLNQE